jgi:hypothetical protein
MSNNGALGFGLGVLELEALFLIMVFLFALLTIPTNDSHYLVNEPIIDLSLDISCSCYLFLL